MSFVRLAILLLSSSATLGLSLPQHELGKRFIAEPRASHLDWNTPRPDTAGFLSTRQDLHSVSYFTNPPRGTPLSQHDEPNAVANHSEPSKRATSGRWESLSASQGMASHPAPVSWGGGRMDLYYMGRDKSCQHKSRDDSKAKWGQWEDLGGSMDSAPATCSRKKDNMHVFCKGTDGQAWHRTYTHNPAKNTGVWGNWQAMGGNCKHYPSTCSWGKDHVSVYVSSADGQCWHRKYDETTKSGWNGWENMGGYLDGPPKAVTWGKDHTSVFCKGQDGQAWHRSYGADGKAGWGQWEALGGSLDSEPAACAWNGRMDMFVKGSDGACWHKTYKNATWGEWENLGGDMKEGAAPEVVQVDGKMEVYITGKDNTMYRKKWENDKWTEGWESMGGSMESKPSAVVWDNGQVDVYGKGMDGTVKRCFS
ncbi:hypothetical protein B0H66DRAFT_624396 [Apodospora peruviana]|uniref:PLL-like beta propeller domain-containing protein n=1 Tax=Apodospora peruviana TaxID=516989 RepID=A0AAE0HZI0_9PEZI|nr:hypothetical protein B0H66DRAFT_624396 [Apodospora peruviana]